MSKLSPATIVVGYGLALATLANVSAARAADNTLKGQVVWAGEAKEQAKLDVTKDQPHCLSKGPLLNEEFVINKTNKGLKNVVVWLTTPDGGKPAGGAAAPTTPVVIDQPVCAFEPRVVAVRQGQVLQVKNSAPVSHNVNWAGGRAKNPGGNVIIAPGADKKITDLKADKQQVAVTCNIHGWMKGWVRVFDHPYYAVTDADGNFEIKNVPAGDFMLVVWHESGFNGGAAGKDGKKITLKAGDNTQKIDFKP